jgi:hypothetical protein
MEFNQVIYAWQKAAIDLEIEIVFPFILETNDDQIFRFELLVKKFGSKLGTIIFHMDEMDEGKIAKKYGYYYSGLNPVKYCVYDRKLFIETLVDWGYFGSKMEKPTWYSGHIY